MENPIKMDDLGVPFFLETPIRCGFWWTVELRQRTLANLRIHRCLGLFSKRDRRIDITNPKTWSNRQLGIGVLPFPKTNSLHLKMMVSYRNLQTSRGSFSGAFAVSFREGRYYLCRSICLRKNDDRELMDMLWLLTPATWYLIVKWYFFTSSACNETWMALFRVVGSVRPSAISSAYEYAMFYCCCSCIAMNKCCHSYFFPTCIQPRLSQTSFFKPFRIIERPRKELQRLIILVHIPTCTVQNLHPLGTIWHPLEGPDMYCTCYIYANNIWLFSSSPPTCYYYPTLPCRQFCQRCLGSWFCVAGDVECQKPPRCDTLGGKLPWRIHGDEWYTYKGHSYRWMVDFYGKLVGKCTISSPGSVMAVLESKNSESWVKLSKSWGFSSRKNPEEPRKNILVLFCS